MFAPVCFDRLPIATRPGPFIPSSLPKIGLESGVATDSIVVPADRSDRGRRMATLVIKTADELIVLDLEDRWRARRAARETEVSKPTTTSSSTVITGTAVRSVLAISSSRAAASSATFFAVKSIPRDERNSFAA
jgi:hypothetical protein